MNMLDMPLESHTNTSKSMGILTKSGGDVTETPQEWTGIHRMLNMIALRWPEIALD